MFQLPCLSSLLLKAMQKGSPERRVRAVPGTAAALGLASVALVLVHGASGVGITFPFCWHGERVQQEAEILLAVVHFHGTTWDQTRLLFSLTVQQA